MSIKTKIYRGPFQAVFKANYNASDKEKLFTNTIDFESYDIELVGEKKYTIESIKTINGINTEKFTPGIVSRHSSVKNVETLYPKEENLRFNPINKNWSSIVIHKPEIPRDSITINEDGVFYGKIKGEAFHFERIHTTVAKKTIKEEKSITPVSVIKSDAVEDKPCFDRNTCFGDDGYLSPSKPMFANNGCFSNNGNSCFYPSPNSCYGSSMGCFNAPPFPCYSTPCFSGCFPGCFGGCFNGCLPGCFQFPLFRLLLNLLGLLGLLYLLFLLFSNLNSNEAFNPNPNPITEDDIEVVEETIIEEEEEIEEVVIEEIEDSEHQVLAVGEGNKVYLTVGDFDLQDKDVVNLYFNDIPIQMNYELIKSPQQIEISDLRINQINTLRVEAVSDGDRGVCTPQVYMCHICNDSNCLPTTQLELKSKIANKNVGHITFYVKEQDCLEELIEKESSELEKNKEKNDDKVPTPEPKNYDNCYNYLQFYMYEDILTISGYEWGGPILKTSFNPNTNNLEILYKRFIEDEFIGNTTTLLKINEEGKIINSRDEILYVCENEYGKNNSKYKIDVKTFEDLNTGQKINFNSKKSVEIIFPEILLDKIIAGCECYKNRDW